MQTYLVIGVMSGTSLDGVDLAFCRFVYEKNQWQFEIVKAVTIPYNDEWKERLAILHKKDALAFVSTHTDYGKYLGNLVRDFAGRNTVDFVASHGHTIFHQPEKSITVQIGDGTALNAACGLPVVCDFRTTDVALGGQGAPLVPIGDKFLFADYTYCLNLGGIANISFDKNRERIAFDICPVNTVLNHLSNQKGKPFDKDGELASKGKVNNELLTQLNHLSYYNKSFPKSLGRENIEKDFLPLINSSSVSIEDKLATFCEHIAFQTATVINSQFPISNSRLLVTGGGAFNTFLINRLKTHCKTEIIIPEKKIIEFKEALIFAFLGVLRWRGEINCLKSVTGASKDSCCGAIYLS